MPLINFRTNLTSLRYGNDRPGGGNSGQPYVQFPIQTENTPDPYGTYYDLNRASLDFPIRGGSISSLAAAASSTLSATLDRVRIEKFFKDAPRGTTFIQKQVGLQLTNPRTQVPQSLEFVGMSIGNVVLPTTQTYNPLNTLAQVAVQGTGAHFNRHGQSPTLFETVQRTYAYYAGDPENNTENTNRLAILRTLKLAGGNTFTNSKEYPATLGIDPSVVDRLGISSIQNQLFNYPGGPGSVYGLGFTRIFRVTNTEPVGDPSTNLVYSNIAMTYSQLAQQTTTNGTDKAHPTPQDYRVAVNKNNDGSNIKQPFFIYREQSLENRLNIGNPGSRLTSPDYTSVNPIGVDSLNFKSPFYYQTTGAGGTDPWQAGGPATNDIIKFAFECMDNNEPGQAIGLVFRAFLEGQIQDSNVAEYNTFKYLGRGETFRTYQGFNRTISFTFKVAAQSRAEMKPLYTKLNHLISQAYPDYSPGTNIMRGNVVKLTIGDYIYRMPGFLENINVTIDNSNTPWEIVLNKEMEEDVRQLPHFVTVACTFLPIMDILPRRVSNRDGDRDVSLIVNTPSAFLEDAIPFAGNVQIAALPVPQPTPLNTNLTIRPTPIL